MAVRPIIDAGSIAWAVMATGTPWDTTIPVTVADNPARFLVAFVKTLGTTTDSVTFNGVSLTRYVDNSSGHGTEIWGLGGDGNIPTGTNNLIVYANATAYGRTYAACFYNVNPVTPTSSPATNTATSAQATVTVQTDVDSVSIMGVGSGNGGRTHTPVETVIGTWQESSQSGCCSYFNGDGSNKTMTDNLNGSDTWHSAGLNLKGADYGSVWNVSPVIGLFEKWKRRTELYRELLRKGAVPLGRPRTGTRDRRELMPI